MSVAIITGASSGIGAELARGIAKRGVDELWLVARREDRLRELGDEIGLKYKVIVADLSCEAGIMSVKSALIGERPTVKYLVNAAGFGDFGAFDEQREGAAARMIDLNVKATVLIGEMVLPFMERGGRIVNLGSASCFTPLPYFNVYASTKSFVLHYTKALNFEISEYGIRATCFCPGWVATEFIGKASERVTVRPRKYWPLLDCKKAVAKCLRAMDKGRAMCVTGWYTKMQHVLFKLVPDPILSRIWLGMLEYPEQKND